MSKKKDKKSEAPEAVDTVSIAAHPRARAAIRRTRAWTGLAAFGIVLFLSMSAGVTGQEAAMRALVAGLVGNLLGWACALAVWRQLVVAELRVIESARAEKRREAAEARAAEAEAKAAAAAAAA
jgi:hypothetical protein